MQMVRVEPDWSTVNQHPFPTGWWNLASAAVSNGRSGRQNLTLLENGCAASASRPVQRWGPRPSNGSMGVSDRREDRHLGDQESEISGL